MMFAALARVSCLSALLDSSACAHHNQKRQRAIELSRSTSVAVNPSLTRRVMIIPCVFGPLIPGSLEHRNFKKRERGIFGKNCSEREIAIRH